MSMKTLRGVAVTAALLSMVALGQSDKAQGQGNKPDKAASGAATAAEKSQGKREAGKENKDSAKDSKAATGQTQLTWWGHAAFVLTTPEGATIAIDPWLKNPKAPQGAAMPTQLDAILVSHGHFDHVGDAAELAKTTNAQVIGSFELTGLIGAQNSVGGNIGGTVKVKDATIHFVEAVHSSGYGQDAKNPQYGGPAMGFVIEIAKGPVLYFAGDTGFFSSMALIAEAYKPTIALLPIGGHFTMDPDGAALAAKLLKVKTIIPMHYGTFPQLAGTPEQLTAALKKGKGSAKVMTLEPGQATTLK